METRRLPQASATRTDTRLSAVGGEGVRLLRCQFLFSVEGRQDREFPYGSPCVLLWSPCGDNHVSQALAEKREQCHQGGNGRGWQDRVYHLKSCQRVKGRRYRARVCGRHQLQVCDEQVYEGVPVTIKQNQYLGEDPVVLIEDKIKSPPKLGGEFLFFIHRTPIFGCDFGNEFYK